MSLFNFLADLTRSPIVILHIGNQPECNHERFDNRATECASGFYLRKDNVHSETILDPLDVLMSVRYRQASSLRQDLENLVAKKNEQRMTKTNRGGHDRSGVPPDGVIGLQMTDDGSQEPLAWFLSGPAMTNLDTQIFKVAAS